MEGHNKLFMYAGSFSIFRLPRDKHLGFFETRLMQLRICFDSFEWTNVRTVSSVVIEIVSRILNTKRKRLVTGWRAVDFCSFVARNGKS